MMKKETFEMFWSTENNEWHETQDSVKARIERTAGFGADEVTLMEGDSHNGIYTRIYFTWRGFGYCIDFEDYKVGRASQWDENAA